MVLTFEIGSGCDEASKARRQHALRTYALLSSIMHLVIDRGT